MEVRQIETELDSAHVEDEVASPSSPWSPLRAADSVMSPSGNVKRDFFRQTKQRESSRLGDIIRAIGARVLGNFWLWNFLWILSTCLIGTICFWVLDPEGFSLVDALFVATSFGTGTGLVTVDFQARTPPCHVTAWLMMLVASPVLMSIVPVMFRLAFQKQKNRRAACSTAFFGLQTLPVDESRALKAICEGVLVYHFGCQFLGWIALWIIYRVDGVPNGGWWPALWWSTSLWNNVGMPMVTGSLMTPWSKHAPVQPYLLLVTTLMVNLGNTCFPIAFRCQLLLRRKFAWKNKDNRVLDLLLRHPRTCYTHLFTASATMWLVMVTVGLAFFTFLAFFIVDFWAVPGRASEAGSLVLFTKNQRLSAIMYQSWATRCGGMTVMDLTELSISSHFVLIVIMWIAASPVVVAMRSSTVQDERDEVLEEAEEQIVQVRTVRKQVSAFMSDNSVLLISLLFAILVAEEYMNGFHLKENTDDKCTAFKLDGSRNADLDIPHPFLAIIFEFASAYGTVGLSTSCKPWSVSGDLCTFSKLCIIVVMFLGRLRDLPDSIDPTVRLNNAFFIHVDYWESQKSENSLYNSEGSEDEESTDHDDSDTSFQW